MGDNGDSHGNSGRETINLPSVGSEATQVDHATDHGNHDHEHPFEAVEDLGHLNEEVRVLLLLSGGSPVHVNGEHVRTDGHGDVERETTEEDDEEWHPSEVLQKRREQSLFAEAVSENGKSDVGHGVEDDDEREED